MTRRQTGPRLSRLAIVKAPGLLPMWYTTAELGTDLGVLPQTVRSWVRLGMPHRRDERNHLWIDGAAFTTWVRTQRPPRRPGALRSDEGYCFKCRGPVPMANPQSRVSGKRLLLTAPCPNCGTTVSRGTRHG
jgi:hypothetical protein